MIGPDLPLGNVKFVRFDAVGNVTEWGQQSAYAVHVQQTRGDRIVTGEGAATTHWVDLSDPAGPVLTPKAENPASLDGMLITGLPMPSTLTINAASYVVSEGIAELEFDLPGTYSVACSALGYLTKTFELTL